MDIRELLVHIRAGSSNRQIAQDMGIDRRTVGRYREWVKAQDLLEGSLPALGDLLTLLEQTMPGHQPPQNISTVEPYRELVAQLVKENAEIAAIKGRLEEQDYSGSYSAVRRFVRQIKPRPPKATVRVERKPGEEAQVDFGYAGQMLDPVTDTLRRTWAFVMLLSWSPVLVRTGQVPPPVRRVRLRPEGRDLAAPASQRLGVVRRRAPAGGHRQPQGSDHQSGVGRPGGPAIVPRVR